MQGQGWGLPAGRHAPPKLSDPILGACGGPIMSVIGHFLGRWGFGASAARSPRGVGRPVEGL